MFIIFFSDDKLCPLCKRKLLARQFRTVYLSRPVDNVQSNQAANAVVESEKCDKQKKSVNIESGGVEETTCATLDRSNALANVGNIGLETATCAESTSDRSNAVANVGNIGVETATCVDSTLDQSNATVTNENVELVGEIDENVNILNFISKQQVSVVIDLWEKDEFPPLKYVADSSQEIDEAEVSLPVSKSDPSDAEVQQEKQRDQQVSVCLDLGERDEIQPVGYMSDSSQEIEEAEVSLPVSKADSSDAEVQRGNQRLLRSKRIPKPVQKFIHSMVRCCVCKKKFPDYDSAFSSTENIVCSAKCLAHSNEA